MKLPRASGILLHPTSLPNKYCIGDFRICAYDCRFFGEVETKPFAALPPDLTGFGDNVFPIEWWLSVNKELTEIYGRNGQPTPDTGEQL